MERDGANALAAEAPHESATSWNSARQNAAGGAASTHRPRSTMELIRSEGASQATISPSNTSHSNHGKRLNHTSENAAPISKITILRPERIEVTSISSGLM